MLRRAGWAVGAVTLLVLLGVAAASRPAVREYLKSSPWLQRLNLPWLRSLDALLYNLRRSPPTPDALGDGGPVSRARLFDPMGLARDPSGTLFVSDRGGTGPGRVVWRFGADSVARVVAGTGRRGTTLGAADARTASLGSPQGLCLDREGRLYLADSYNHVVLRLDPSGALTRVAGTGTPGDRGDGGPAVAARLNQPYDVRVDTRGNLYIADVGNHRVRRVDPAGRISTVAGTGEPGYSGDDGPATRARLRDPFGLWVDARYGLLIADSGNDVVRQVDDAGVIRTIAGTGRRGLSGDGGPAVAARLDSPQGLFVDQDGTIYVNDEHNHAIRAFAPGGPLERVAGTGVRGFTRDGSPAAAARLDDVENLALADGRLVFTEAGNRRVRLIDAQGRLRTLAGASPAGPDE